MDNSKTITIYDVRLLLQVYINSNSSTTWSEKDLYIMDLNDDEKVDIKDVRLLLQMYVNS